MFKVLAINPGSTSTKVAIFEDEVCLWKDNIWHPTEDLQPFLQVGMQYAYRLNVIKDKLQEKGFALSELAAVVGRGGMLKPLAGGTYLVDEQMVEELLQGRQGEHASNLGGIMAYHLAGQAGIPAYIVDPVSVDEFEPVARLSGLPEIPRLSQSHALNMKAVARKTAQDMGRSYQSVNLVIAHLGSGISVSAHCHGQMVDVNNANHEGPFSPERCGGLPAYSLVKLCYSGQYTEKEMISRLLKEGGLYAYLGTKDAREAEKRLAAGDDQAKLVLQALCYQVAKEIGAMSAVLAGRVDRIILTGGLAYSRFITGEISRKVSFIAPVVLVPGEEEMQSLAMGALRVLRQEEKFKVYLGDRGDKHAVQ